MSSGIVAPAARLVGSAHRGRQQVILSEDLLLTPSCSFSSVIGPLFHALLGSGKDLELDCLCPESGLAIY